MICNRIRGHWGRGTTPFCACPTPTDSPAARLGDDADRFEVLAARFAGRTITEAEIDEYAGLWNRAFPAFTPWVRRTPVLV